MSNIGDNELVGLTMTRPCEISMMERTKASTEEVVEAAMVVEEEEVVVDLQQSPQSSRIPSKLFQ